MIALILDSYSAIKPPKPPGLGSKHQTSPRKGALAKCLSAELGTLRLRSIGNDIQGEDVLSTRRWTATANGTVVYIPSITVMM